MMQNIILFGTGDRGKKIFQFLQEVGADILFWIDSDPDKWNTRLFDLPVYQPGTVRKYKESVICISAVDAKKEMYHTLLGYGIPKERIVGFSEMIIRCGKEVFKSDIAQESGNGFRQNILFDCMNGLGLGGVETWSMQLAEELLKYGRSTSLVVPQNAKAPDHRLETQILPVKAERNQAFSARNIKGIAESLEKKLPCTVITSCVNDFFLATCILKEWHPKQVKILSVVHQGIPAAYKEQADMQQYVDRYIGVSEDIRQGICEQGIETDRVLHMTCPVACADRLERTYTEDAASPIRIGYAGRLEVIQKRLDLLPGLLLELDRRKVDYQLEIAGMGAYVDTLLECIKDTGAEKRVHLCGMIERNQMSCFWRRQDICINLSDYEGRSISVMEAMANGAVPVVTKTSGVREDIADGESGYLIEIGDYARMADVICELEKKRFLLKDMGEKAFESISEKCRMKDHIEFWNQVLKELW